MQTKKERLNMSRYQYSVYKRETGSAGGKAKNDAYDILLKEGFRPTYTPQNNRQIRIMQQIFSISRLRADTELIIQYPAISRELMNILLKKIKHISSATALIHDLPSIQGMGGTLENEITTLNYFDNLIVHNRVMSKYLMKMGYKGKIVELGLFDYLHDSTKPITECNKSGVISIAGNLDKSRYVCELGKLRDCYFNLYGINKTLDLSNIYNAKYFGVLNSDEIVYKLEGDYGLVWDGESIDECSGIYGKYLQYNNPHKLSLYIAAGKPVITWKKAAIAQFVERENIGITVDSLRELEKIDLMKDYDAKRSNVLKIKNRIANGYYLSQAIESIYR